MGACNTAILSLQRLSQSPSSNWATRSQHQFPRRKKQQAVPACRGPVTAQFNFFGNELRMSNMWHKGSMNADQTPPPATWPGLSCHDSWLLLSSMPGCQSRSLAMDQNHRLTTDCRAHTDVAASCRFHQRHRTHQPCTQPWTRHQGNEYNTTHVNGTGLHNAQ